MPEALLRLGELEWEDARDGFLVDFQAVGSDARPISAGEPP